MLCVYLFVLGSNQYLLPQYRFFYIIMPQLSQDNPHKLSLLSWD